MLQTKHLETIYWLNSGGLLIEVLINDQLTILDKDIDHLSLWVDFIEIGT